ncbi:redoxin domain-containing protein [Hymenobacter sp. NST-14]|uniref:peroxiredoxin family protein n=1 Tax=Hymenobacter piscis TaxID=2839984 RepID=UPI001C00C1C6|nr:redoxin domain-containing protein [Hymenobacter piscis]MBT9391601.1 redoxin domain-containing protein [Hymenobacter piscis]
MRPQQVLLLGLILLVPVLAFLFLKSFGTNRYALPTYLPERVDSTLVAGKWQRDTVFHQVGEFALRTQAGRQLTGAELRSQGLYVLTTYAADCGLSCERQNAQLVRVQEKFRHDARVRLASLSLNSDSAVALARQAESYGAIAGKWFFLAADKSDVDRLLTREFGLTPAPGAATPRVALLIDRNGYVRGRYDGTSERDMNRLITEINVLLYTYEHP